MNLDACIEQALVKVEHGTLESGTYFQELATAHPEIFTYLFDADTRLLLETEHDYLLFLAMICIESMRSSGIDINEIDLETIEDMDEHNWGLLEHTSIQNITETVSRHPGFALYAFLEESCTPEKEHEILSEAAVELVYVKCKSLVDCAFLAGENRTQ